MSEQLLQLIDEKNAWRQKYEGVQDEVRGLRTSVAMASKAVSALHQSARREEGGPRASGGVAGSALECAVALLRDAGAPHSVQGERWEVLRVFLDYAAAGGVAGRPERPLSSDRLHAVLTDIAYSDTVHEGALAELGCLLARAPPATLKALPLVDVVRAIAAQLGLALEAESAGRAPPDAGLGGAFCLACVAVSSEKARAAVAKDESAITRVARLLASASSSPATLEFGTLALAHAAMLLDGARKVLVAAPQLCALLAPSAPPGARGNALLALAHLSQHQDFSSVIGAQPDVDENLRAMAMSRNAVDQRRADTVLNKLRQYAAHR